MKKQTVYTIVEPDEHFIDALADGYWMNKKTAKAALKSGGYGDGFLVKVECDFLEFYREKKK
jgi:hypothetical protein